MASLPPIKWPTGRTPSKVEIFLYEHKGGRVALHVADELPRPSRFQTQLDRALTELQRAERACSHRP